MSWKLTTAEAIKEARRCLNCAKPNCRTGCPIGNNIPQFIRALTEGNMGTAFEIISERSNLPAICSRVCPHERQCEAACNLAKNKHGIQIGSLEMFIADFAYANDLKPIPPSTGARGKVAIIGSGPAGLTVAGDLAKMNFAVTIFEAQPEPGGVLLFGIPDFRLNKAVVRREIQHLLHLGVEIKTNVLVGPDINMEDMFAQGYDAIFMATGTSLPRILNIPGKDLAGIVPATYYLQTVFLVNEGKLDKKETLLHENDRVIVIGAGNVGMDAARTAVRRGASEVTVIHHKAESDITAFPSEYQAALKEGIKFSFLRQPIAYLNKKQMRALKNIRQQPDPSDETTLAGILMQNIVKTDDGRFVPEGGQEYLPCDSIILAIGQRSAARIASNTKGIQVDRKGYIVTKEHPYGMTTRPGVFSSGDVVHGPATVVLAIRESKKVAVGIAQYIDAKNIMENCQK